MPAARTPIVTTLRAWRRTPLQGAALAAAFALAVTATVTPVAPATADPACGAFTDDAHVVRTPEHLAAIGSGMTGADCDPARTYRLDNDIVVPARDTSVVPLIFQGRFEGGGHSITLDIDRTTVDSADVGLFQALEGALITDLTLEGSVRTAGTGSIAALAAVAFSATVVDVTSTVDVAGREMVGGLVGSSSGATLGLVSVTVGTSSDPVEVRAVREAGGLVGRASSAIEVSGSSDVHVSIIPAAEAAQNDDRLVAMRPSARP